MATDLEIFKIKLRYSSHIINDICHNMEMTSMFFFNSKNLVWFFIITCILSYGSDGIHLFSMLCNFVKLEEDAVKSIESSLKTD